MLDNDAFLEFIRHKSCCVCGQSTYHADTGEWLVDPSHLKHRGMGGNKNLKHVGITTPKCRKHHVEFHRLGMPAFQDKYNINLWSIAKDLASEWRTKKAREDLGT